MAERPAAAGRGRATAAVGLSLVCMGVLAAPAAAIPAPAQTAAQAGAVAAAPPTPPPRRRPPRPRRVIGCHAAGASYRLAGPRARRVVALTFDDGPGIYTPRVLGILRRLRVNATFFVIGEQVRGNETLLRRELADGNAIGNHTFTHANVSGGGIRQMLSTQGAVRRATGYTPCLFRAPYGAVSGLLIRQARSLGMNSIEWSVDPRDWSRPGTGAVYSRIVSATRPGAIILMHDGGGPRGQTVAALPRVIATLRARGYRFATLPALLGLAPRYAT
ncbi:MAG: polysaccharide deacetylase family protein [Solirubrobacteraceae bacterium]